MVRRRASSGRTTDRQVGAFCGEPTSRRRRPGRITLAIGECGTETRHGAPEETGMSEVQRSDVIRTAQGSLETVPPLESLTLSASVFNRAVARVTARRAAAHDLKLSEFAIVRLLLSDAEWTASGIAEVISFEASTVSRIVAGLVDKGLVQKRQSLEDRRRFLFSLTDEGVSLGLELLGETHPNEGLITEDIDPVDLECCAVVFGRIVRNYVAWERSGSRVSPAPADRLN